MKKSLQGFWKSFKGLFSRKAQPPGGILKPPPSEEIQKGLPKIVKPSTEKLYIQVGIDFGTSCSKVCYQVHGGAHKANFVDFNHPLRAYPRFAVPSVLCGDGKGGLLIGEKAGGYIEGQGWGHGIRNFKTLLAAQNNSDFSNKVSEDSFKENLNALGIDSKLVGPAEITAVYIAYMMARCRDILSRQYENRRLNINYNICVPIDYIQRNRVKKDFEGAFAVAQELEKSWDGQSVYSILERAAELKGRCNYDENDPETAVFAIPEAVAEMAAYRMSAARDVGLHALIDIGSGTTDVSIFNLERGVEERAVWYASGAIPFGIYKLEKVAADVLRKYDREATFEEVCKALEQIRERSDGVQQEIFLAIQKESRSFIDHEYRSPWKDARRKLRKESSWEKVKIFLSGGGSQMAYLQSLFSSPVDQNIRGRGVRYPVAELSCPQDLGTGLSSDFWRKAVAFGLSFPKPKLGEYILPKDALDDTPPPLPCKDWGDRDDTR